MARCLDLGSASIPAAEDRVDRHLDIRAGTPEIRNQRLAALPDGRERVPSGAEHRPGRGDAFKKLEIELGW